MHLAEIVLYLRGSLIGSLPAALFAFMAYIKGHENERAIQGVHDALNSRLTQLLVVTAAEQHAAGRREGIDSLRKPFGPAEAGGSE